MDTDVLLSKIDSYLESQVSWAESDDIFQEGVLSSIKNFVVKMVKKTVDFIAKCFQKLIAAVKWVYGKIKVLFHKFMDKKLIKPIKVSFINLSGKASVGKTICDSTSKVQVAAEKSINSLTQEIYKKSKISIESIKTLLKMKEPVREDLNIEKNSNEKLYGMEKKLYSDEDHHSLQGKDFFDANDKEAIDKFNKKELEAVLEAEDKVKAYQEYTTNYIQKRIDAMRPYVYSMDKFKEYLAEKDQSISTNNLDTKIYNILCSGSFGQSYTTQEIVKILTDTNYIMMPRTQKEAEAIVSARLEYNKELIRKLSDMIKINYKLLGISSKKCDMLIYDATEGDNEQDIMKVVLKGIFNNAKIFVKEKGHIDFSMIGGGHVYYALETYKATVGMTLVGSAFGKGDKAYDKFILKGGRATPMDELDTNPAPMLPYSFSYDCVIYSHGFCLKNMSGNKFWACLPVKMQNTKSMWVKDLLKKAISLGYNKINLVICNPGHIELSKDKFIDKDTQKELDSRDVSVRYSENSVNLTGFNGYDEKFKKYIQNIPDDLYEKTSDPKEGISSDEASPSVFKRIVAKILAFWRKHKDIFSKLVKIFKEEASFEDAYRLQAFGEEYVFDYELPPVQELVDSIFAPYENYI